MGQKAGSVPKEEVFLERGSQEGLILSSPWTAGSRSEGQTRRPQRAGEASREPAENVPEMKEPRRDVRCICPHLQSYRKWGHLWSLLELSELPDNVSVTPTERSCTPAKCPKTGEQFSKMGCRVLEARHSLLSMSPWFRASCRRRVAERGGQNTSWAGSSARFPLPETLRPEPAETLKIDSATACKGV